MKLKEIMSPIDTFYEPGDSLLMVAKTLAEKHHSCGLICEYDKPVGIITERDIVRLLTSDAKPDLAIREVMTHRPICVDANTELMDALDLAKSRNLRHLPVVDATQRLVGLVTIGDMVKAKLTSIENDDLQERPQNRRLNILAIEDPLTGLPNRRAMDIDLRHAAAIARRRSEYYSIALIDLDHFEKFNDEYGHPAGDEALTRVAGTLRENLRESEKIYRYTGGQFLFLMSGTPVEAAETASKRICQAISEKKFVHKQSSFGHLTVSIGVAGGVTENWESIIEQADSALHDAKDSGRNTVCVNATTKDSPSGDLGAQ